MGNWNSLCSTMVLLISGFYNIDSKKADIGGCFSAPDYERLQAALRISGFCVKGKVEKRV